MNVKRILGFVGVMLFAMSSLAQETAPPFAIVDAAFKKNRLQWSRASQPFQAERARLGQDFEPELWKYLGDNVDKQDRIANFLLYPEYLHGSLPMPFLARRIQLKTLALLEGKKDLSSRVEYVTASINVAVLSAELDLNNEAETHKKAAEQMMATDRFLMTAFPAMDDYDRCVYDSIGNSAVSNPAAACRAKVPAVDTEVASVEMGAIERERVLANPDPKWPKAAKANLQPGAVKIRISTDENGKVESADVVSGPAELQEAALKSAKASRLRETHYKGRPVKVQGVLEYPSLGQHL